MYVDFHSHILPCVDHGSDGVETSLRQLGYACSANIDTIVATPHFYPQIDTVEDFLDRRKKAFEELSEHDLSGIKIIQAAEVMISAGIEGLEGLEKLCIEGTNYILLELPQEPWPFWIAEAAYRIAATRNLRPICAHIDRYSREGQDKILEMGVDVQLNADALVSGIMRRYKFKKLADQGYIHILGSDAHGEGEIAYSNFALAMKCLGPMAEQMTNNARKILTGDFIY